jgi:hypothetical protein
MREVEDEEYHNKQHAGYEKERIKKAEKNNKAWRWKMR